LVRGPIKQSATPDTSFRVYFRITGFKESTHHVSEVMGLKPTRTLKKGVRPSAEASPHRNNGWEYGIRSTKGWDVEPLLRRLLRDVLMHQLGVILDIDVYPL
jgi:hypothetical protein